MPKPHAAPRMQWSPRLLLLLLVLLLRPLPPASGQDMLSTAVAGDSVVGGGGAYMAGTASSVGIANGSNPQAAGAVVLSPRHALSGAVLNMTSQPSAEDCALACAAAPGCLWVNYCTAGSGGCDGAPGGRLGARRCQLLGGLPGSNNSASRMPVVANGTAPEQLVGGFPLALAEPMVYL